MGHRALRRPRGDRRACQVAELPELLPVTARAQLHELPSARAPVRTDFLHSPRALARVVGGTSRSVLFTSWLMTHPSCRPSQDGRHGERTRQMRSPRRCAEPLCACMCRVRDRPSGAYSESKGKASTDAQLDSKVKHALELLARDPCLSLREASRRALLSTHKQVERTKKAMLLARGSHSVAGHSWEWNHQL